MKTIGIINTDFYEKAKKMGLSLTHGCCNKKDGRVRLFCRQFPGTSKSGYALRSRIVWWIYKEEVLSGCKFNLHHKNNNRSDDRIENLEKLTHTSHAHKHNGYRWNNVKFETRKCENCSKEFIFESSRSHDFSGGIKKRGRFCSQECYHKFPRVLKTHCSRGHEFVEGSYYRIVDKYGNKSKSCKLCRKK